MKDATRHFDFEMSQCYFWAREDSSVLTGPHPWRPPDTSDFTRKSSDSQRIFLTDHENDGTMCSYCLEVNIGSYMVANISIVLKSVVEKLELVSLLPLMINQGNVHGMRSLMCHSRTLSVVGAINEDINLLSAPMHLSPELVVVIGEIFWRTTVDSCDEWREEVFFLQMARRRL